MTRKFGFDKPVLISISMFQLQRHPITIRKIELIENGYFAKGILIEGITMTGKTSIFVSYHHFEIVKKYFNTQRRQLIPREEHKEFLLQFENTKPVCIQEIRKEELIGKPIKALSIMGKSTVSINTAKSLINKINEKFADKMPQERSEEVKMHIKQTLSTNFSLVGGRSDTDTILTSPKEFSWRISDQMVKIKETYHYWAEVLTLQGPTIIFASKKCTLNNLENQIRSKLAIAQTLGCCMAAWGFAKEIMTSSDDFCLEATNDSTTEFSLFKNVQPFHLSCKGDYRSGTILKQLLPSINQTEQKTSTVVDYKHMNIPEVKPMKRSEFYKTPSKFNSSKSRKPILSSYTDIQVDIPAQVPEQQVLIEAQEIVQTTEYFDKKKVVSGVQEKSSFSSIKPATPNKFAKSQGIEVTLKKTHLNLKENLEKKSKLRTKAPCYTDEEALELNQLSEGLRAKILEAELYFS